MNREASISAPCLSDALADELADILADALVADIRDSRNVPEIHARGSPTGSSPSGYVRRQTGQTV